MNPPSQPITVRLRGAETPAATPAATPPPASAPASAPVAGPKLTPAGGPSAALSRRRRVVEVATRYYVALPALALALALGGWSFVRLGRPALVVKARAASAPAADALKPAPSPDEIAKLRQRLTGAGTNLLAGREQIVPALAAMEERARRRGWRFEVSMQPALAPLAGLEGVQRIPAALKLENLGATPDGASSAGRLAALLDEFCLGDKRVDLARLSVRADESGITEASVVLHFWTLLRDEKTAAK